MPTLTLAVYNDLARKLRTHFGGDIRLMRRVAVCRAQDRGNAGGFEAVLEVVGQQLVRSRDRDRAELVQTDDDRPELPVAL